mmetsp:Transcript_9227/g.10754  ORF Transcript_9227/g.10754 Transcript_9227/m.10754 type:complete len:81 (+) Transcript_9227:1105-1347(+)
MNRMAQNNSSTQWIEPNRIKSASRVCGVNQVATMKMRNKIIDRMNHPFTGDYYCFVSFSSQTGPAICGEVVSMIPACLIS